MLVKVKIRDTVLINKMNMSELKRVYSFYWLLLAVARICYFDLRPVTGAGIILPPYANTLSQPTASN